MNITQEEIDQTADRVTLRRKEGPANTSMQAGAIENDNMDALFLARASKVLVRALYNAYEDLAGAQWYKKPQQMIEQAERELEQGEER